MPARREVSHEVHHGMITPPASPVDTNPHLHERSAAFNTRIISLKDPHQETKRICSHSAPTSHASRSSDQDYRHSKRTRVSLDSSNRSENAPPKHEERTSILFGDPNAYSASTRRRTSGNNNPMCVNDTHSRRQNRKKASSVKSVHPVRNVGAADALVPTIQTFDGQSSLELTQSKFANVEEAEPGTVVLDLTRKSCFLADCTLDQRLRPTQRIQAYRTPVSQVSDRFITPRRVHESTKDIFILGKAVSKLGGQEELRRMRTSSSDPFGPARVHPRFAASLQFSRMQALRGIYLPSVNILRHRQEPSSDTNRRTRGRGSWNAGVVSPWANNLSGSTIGSSTTPVYSSDFLQQALPRDDLRIYEDRLALAFDVDQTSRVLEIQSSATSLSRSTRISHHPTAGKKVQGTIWRDNEWCREGISTRMEMG